jgi:hypothetical protein
MGSVDSRRQPGNNESLWRQPAVRITIVVCLLMTAGLVMKMEITEAALRGAEVSVITFYFCLSAPFALGC